MWQSWGQAQVRLGSTADVTALSLGAGNPTVTTVTNKSSEVWGLVRVFSELCVFLTQSRKLSLLSRLSGKESTC